MKTINQLAHASGDFIINSAILSLPTLTWTPSTLKVWAGGVSFGTTRKNSFPPIISSLYKLISVS